ncbi:hypothetical protein OIO90_006211 [Microbotryomycetes sp. JL221]|nr:hypothetical protein OIO90_006211 [Microbotryomycetes sp. JL221]
MASQIAFIQPTTDSVAQSLPYRPLPWGDINIISTTDTHGWLRRECNGDLGFCGDFGQLVSFVHSIKHQAKQRKADLLVVDSGDRLDGNGLVDGEPDAHTKGWTAMGIFRQMPYDIITTGNHELYQYPKAVMTQQRLVKHYGERYVTSNVNLTTYNTLPNGTIVETTKPLGNRYRKFKTAMGRNVTAFGPLFNFRAHDKGISVQAPHDMVNESWFIEAIQDRPSLFLLVGHMSVRKEPDSEWRVIVKAIRKLHPTVPIAIFGGHHHIRDCTQEDPWSMSLAAGRYMETVGWMSIKGVDEPNPSQQPLTFERRYLDQNEQTFKFHTEFNFETEKGKTISKQLKQTAQQFNLTLKFGQAPQSYYLYRYLPWSKNSILRLMTQEVLPRMIQRQDRPFENIVILNTGSIRFDIFKGSFTRNDQWIILPFTNHFLFISGVKKSIVQKLLPYLNIVGEHHLSNDLMNRSSFESFAANDVKIEHLYRRSLSNSFQRYYNELNLSTERERIQHEELTLGYVTYDECDDLGDDTKHRPLPIEPQPIFVSTSLSNKEDSIKKPQEEILIDVVFFDFIELDILNALNQLQNEKTFTHKDVELYLNDLTANTLMQEYASKYWN